MTVEAQRAHLLEVLRRHALRVAQPGESFTLASGRQSHYFVNGKELTLRPDGLSLVAALMLDRLAGSGVQAVGGMSIGADPIIGAMVAMSASTAQPLQGFVVRPTTKDHGLKDRLAGPSLAGLRRAVMVEDTTTTGGSTISAIEAVHELYPELVIDRVLTIVDREEGARENFAAAGFNFETLFTKSDLGV